MASIPSVISLLKNMRMHSPQQIDPRPGMSLISLYASGFYGTNVHSIKRMNSGASFIRLVGINANLVELVSNTLVGTGFSGNPLSMVPFRPEQSPLPWMYVADSNQMRKISMTLENWMMGVATPLNPPSTSRAHLSLFGPQSFQVIYDFTASTIATDWAPSGGTPTMVQANQFSGTIVAALPDIYQGWPSFNGGVITFPGFASIVGSFGLTAVVVGSIMNFAALPGLDIPVTQTIAAAFGASTISTIVFNTGTGFFDITIPSSAALLTKGAVVNLSGTEDVSVISCVKNPNGTFTFQCLPTLSHAGGDTVTPQSTIRCYIPTAITPAALVGTAFSAKSMNAAISGAGTFVWTFQDLEDLSMTNVNGVRPIQTTGATPDNIFLAFLCDAPANVTSVKVQFDVDSTTNDFSTNYYSFTKAGGFSSGWQIITIPITSLVRTGADTSRTLANVAAIRLTVVTSGVVDIGFADFWIGGPYGPSVGLIGAPYQYLVVARSTETGALSNGSPATRVGVSPTGNGSAVAIYMTNDADPQLATFGVYDVYRFGGTLTAFTFIGTMPNPAPGQVSVLFDVFPDSAIASNPQLQTDNFQPFPTIDTPKSGIVNTDGTQVIWVSGDPFNVNWSQGTQITINGLVYSFYQQPTAFGLGGWQVQLNQVVGELTGVTYQINQATILGVPLPFLWGPFAQGTASFMFAVGDLHQPGVLFLTKGNNPDSGPDILQIEITSPSEPLINGCMYDGTSYVFSSDRLFRLYPLFGQTIIVTNGTVSPAQGTNLFTPIEVPNGKGLFAPWGLSVGRKIRFIGRDGIYQTTGGEPELLTGIDWGQFFPHEGHPGAAITLGPITVFPPDFTQINALRLSEYDSCLYFDFIDINGENHTLVLDDTSGSWSYDSSTPFTSLHYGEEGEQVHSILLGAVDGNVYQASGSGDPDGDGNPFECAIYSPVMTEGTSRYQTTRNAYIGLLGEPGNVTLGMQMNQGPPQAVQIPITMDYQNIFSNMPAMKGRLQSWFLDAPIPFILFMRDGEFGLKPWGDEGAFRPVDPFASLKRVQSPRSQ